MFRKLQGRMGAAWCRMSHGSVMWPLHGEYRCRTCGRRYPAFSETPRAYQINRAALKSAVSLLLVAAVITLARPAGAANMVPGQTTAEAEAVLERYFGFAGFEAWPVESVEIHAALPKMAKAGELRGIRRLSSIGASRYEIVELAGDRTVKKQVIARYLKAEERASELSAKSVAITPANYRFSFLGVVDDGEYLAYAFQITPRRKRPGLIQGEIWLDQGTGVPVRQFGRLVKSSSAFFRRVSVIRENALRDGIVESRLTHIKVETRSIGQAELVIEERPLRSQDDVEFGEFDTP
jgi:hypothetical protein